TLLSSS
ncbi:hypothetical protein S7711_11607, partial [Stachybotrys chartarum IBT 7711]